MRQVQPAFAFRRPSRIVSITLVVLSVLWVVYALSRFWPGIAQVFSYLPLYPSAVVNELELWRLVTYPLLHHTTSAFHLLFNGLILYWAGSELERRWGGRRFLGFMLLTTLAGGVFVVIAWLLGLSIANSVIGASAITEGLIVAWGLIFRDRTIYFFFVLPMRGLHIIWFAILLAVLDAISTSPVSAAAHFGGIFMGLVLASGIWRTNKMKLWWDDLLVKLRLRKSPKLYIVPKGPSRYDIN